MKLTKNKLKEMIREELKLIEGKKLREEKMRPAVKKLLKQKGYGPIFQAIDNSKRQFKQMRYSRGEIQDTLIDMFGDEDPKILKKIKEGKLNEDKLKPAFAKKAKDVIEKVLGTNVEYDGENVFTAKGERAAGAPLGTIFIDYYKHPLFGDTFEIFSTMSGVTGTEKAENSRDALKALIKFTKKNKRTFLK